MDVRKGVGRCRSVRKGVRRCMKDNSAFDNLPALAEAGVYSLKVEGRIKKPHYVYSVVSGGREGSILSRKILSQL